jgi:hypothetical protein
MTSNYLSGGMHMADVVHLGEIDPNAITSDIRDPEGNIVHEGNVDKGSALEGQCWFNGEAYSTGARVCQQNKVLVCDQWGAWERTFDSC